MKLESGLSHVSSWGYACFLTVNATSVWGGIFPFLPLAFQTASVTLTFFLAQAVSFGGAFIASMWGSYYFPHGARRMLVSLSAILLFIGSACLIAAMYLDPLTLWLVGAGGVLLGIGCAGMFMLWQRFFASLPAREGNLYLMVGTAIAPFIYFALYLVPIALTAFLIPLIFVPLCGLCVALSVREMRFDQPMFEDVPRQHPRVYRQVVADYWRSALCVGALTFASGVIRGVALLHEEISLVVNSASMIGAFLSAAVLLLLWYRMSFRFGLTSVFRVVYPLLITGFLLLPFCGPVHLNLFAAAAYMVFSLVQMLMMMQCAQVSRDRGINPVFIYGFFGGVAYIMQSGGFLLGWTSNVLGPSGSTWLFVIAMVSSYVLGLTLLVATGTLFKPVVAKGTVTVDPIEFQALSAAAERAGTPEPAKRRRPVAVAPDTPLGVTDVAKDPGSVADASDAPAAPVARPKRRRNRPSASEDAGAIRDRVSKQCLQLQESYGLSARETEVMELIARGNSMAAIADRLVISENTVRTHAKHIYTKLDIHKRQELLDRLHALDD
ncbi:LuxR C-terminal-related transcriptional regulator [Adlercreutzia equolifaciens]|uniref:LuxR C-terminal-related transcriptional regulator n=1 Tax=Adlercreutzia equolifaciens TaxID=446660 RepID=UPI0023B053FB|nr:LuxR C-terminal-related transcriptional regulator [Adlercreutzia equolifaciens]MDE8703493.1 LuxR C-terminal-related transcriptional regulator [Adlercreutzia equolifaciens]